MVPMKNKKKMKRSVFYTVIALILAAVLMVVLGYGYGQENAVEPTPSPTPAPTPVPTPTPEPTPTPLPEGYFETDRVLALYEELQEDQAINDDVRGILCFDSELVHQPVVQGASNDTYLRTDWQTMQYISYGSIFMEAENEVETDQNLIIYGHLQYHRVNQERTLAFTPLEVFRSEEGYEPNKYLCFVTDTEVRYYVVARVFDCALYESGGYMYVYDNQQYNLRNYDASYFNTYMNTVNSLQFYDTGVEMTADDQMITLQTCIEFDEMHRQIMICKEIGRESIEELQNSVE